MEKPFKIGIWSYENGSYKDGGAFSYTKKMSEILLHTNFGPDFELVSVGYEIDMSNPAAVWLKPIYKKTALKILNSILLRIPFIGNTLSKELKLKHDKKLIKQLVDARIELIYYVQPGVAFYDYPHIATVWDNGHLSTFSFPEVSMNGILESRLENALVNLNKALLICCESNTGKFELERHYGINTKKLEVIPMIASEVITPNISPIPVNLPENEGFFLYPAKYWPHKNHYHLIKAFAIFAKKYPNVKLIFTGHHQNNKQYIDECILQENLQDKVIQLGVISLEHLKWLYLNAKAMVMTSLLGPTNMPLMEAYYLGCKVLCSNLEGHKEQLGDYALYFDGLDASDIANKLELTYLDKSVVEAEKPSQEFRKTVTSLKSMFEKAKSIRRIWGHFE